MSWDTEALPGPTPSWMSGVVDVLIPVAPRRSPGFRLLPLLWDNSLSLWQNAWGISVLEEPFLQHPAMGTGIHPPESSLQWALAPISISCPCRFRVQGDGAGLAAQCWEG